MTPVSQTLKELGSLVIDLVFPLRCLGCSQYGAILCPACRESLPRLKPPLCPKCSKPLAQSRACSWCQEMPLTIDGIRSPYAMEGLVREAVHGLKYRGWKALARPMGELLAEFLAEEPLFFDVILPVPLHPKRLRQRGYNQAELLAAELGKRVEVPVATSYLWRVRHSLPQARSTSAAERWRNVAGAFACREAGVYRRRVLLVDDVCTTGATLEACCMAARGAGAASVFGLTFAREV